MFKSFYFDHTKANLGTMNRFVAAAESQGFVILSVPHGVKAESSILYARVYEQDTDSIYFGVGQDTDFEVFHPNQLNDFIPGAREIVKPTFENLMDAMEAYFQ